MRERPILFADAMVRAILGGRKTQTRRIVKLAPCEYPYRYYGLHEGEHRFGEAEHPEEGTFRVPCPFGAPGDLLWVRECWANIGERSRPRIVYRADAPDGERVRVDAPWRPSIHMPRVASRLTLRVTSVRVERLRDITEEDARAEGVVWVDGAWRVDGIMASTASGAFSMLWDRLAQPGSTWDANPWTWVVGFERVEASR